LVNVALDDGAVNVGWKRRKSIADSGFNMETDHVGPRIGQIGDYFWIAGQPESS
jgi:hypothetical protein